MGRHVLGLNPLSLNHVNTVMDKALRGHPYVKSAIGAYGSEDFSMTIFEPICCTVFYSSLILFFESFLFMQFRVLFYLNCQYTVVCVCMSVCVIQSLCLSVP